jgi:hypothetical protein
MAQTQLFWHEAANYDQEVFAAAGLANFADLWDLESHPPADAELKPMRQHLHRRRGVILRQTVRIRLNRCEYFLKRAGGSAFPCIVNEHRAVNQVAEFGLVPPRLVAWGFDETEWRGMLLFKRLPGYDSLQDLLEFKAPHDVVADFQTRKKDVLKQVTRIIRRVQHAGYFYPDWHGKHLFVRRNGDDIVLIDLERFRHLRDCPWYYRLFFVRHFVRRREWATLRRALGSPLYTPRYLLSLLEE